MSNCVNRRHKENFNSLSANNLDPDQDQQNVDPDLGPYYLILNKNYGEENKQLAELPSLKDVDNYMCLLFQQAQCDFGNHA